ncbi:uncharacterized protein ASCRUDRAFT_68082 [Ascoidea rubescens DSM 1968]|uniref:MYND-type domain-containing protein n=1 Tax=Ascoidea rubescens DSM 1968 TaxID=1344418 RepID=A0A1D2VR44_9ASCO|nr:hypothetical protein ASCRUDRAFT_68082 [Ascoidea rubescens DSM 1968]ODV64045.1 hypothetical protein ASCRUDRAFT_68082 [Ascoidea rubescens DSM 1968]
MVNRNKNKRRKGLAKNAKAKDINNCYRIPKNLLMVVNESTQQREIKPLDEIPAGDIICKLQPEVKVINNASSLLVREDFCEADTDIYCNNCCKGLPGYIYNYTPELDRKTSEYEANSDDCSKRKLLVCNSCNLLSYCSQTCLEEDFDDVHFIECKVYQEALKHNDRIQLQKILKSSIRMILRILIVCQKDKRIAQCYRQLLNHWANFSKADKRDLTQRIYEEMVENSKILHELTKGFKYFSGSGFDFEKLSGTVSRYLFR